jgi:alkylation response protein AidB-like acyl-CoA dehydrogenase
MKQYDEVSVLSLKRTIFQPHHEEFRKNFREFIATEIRPNYSKYEKQGYVDAECYRKASRAGFYCFDIPTEHGGKGLHDFCYNAIVAEELEHMDCGGVFFTLGNDMCLSYFTTCCTLEQRKKWLPKIAKENKILAVAMSEPEMGSDLAGVTTTAVKTPDGRHYILNGRKMWISNGRICDYVVVVCYTERSKNYKGMSLVVVERGMEGFETAKTFGKLGKHAQDTCLLTFENVKVPVENLIGQEGDGFVALMKNLPKERLSIAISSMGSARRVLALTTNYVHSRHAFSNSLGNFQTVQFKLAELRTEIQVGTVFQDACIAQLTQGALSTETASMAKYWCTELANRVANECLQLFGGYGYLKNAPIAKHFADQRVMKIYGGANEVMKEIIAKGLGFKPQRATSKL